MGQEKVFGLTTDVWRRDFIIYYDYKSKPVRIHYDPSDKGPEPSTWNFVSFETGVTLPDQSYSLPEYCKKPKVIDRKDYHKFSKFF